jgi:hypothetical protein
VLLGGFVGRTLVFLRNALKSGGWRCKRMGQHSPKRELW